MHSHIRNKGFTLVEMIVSVALFSIVILVCVGSLLALVGANRKVHALQSVLNNLNVSMDGMVRGIRMGSKYDASGQCTGGNTGGGPRDCTGGGKQFAFMPYGSPSGTLPTVYRLNTTSHRLERQINGGTFTPITSSEITIEDMNFYLVGSNRCYGESTCDLNQPKVVIVIKGTAPVASARSKSTFHIQVTAVQRILDV
jgi:prepilin-type N-terminal cleavage/methylation domain-containing protein